MPTPVQVFHTLTFQGGYNANLVIMGTTLLGITAGTLGVFAMLAKRSLMADALSHAALPGITGAFLAAGALSMTGKAIPLLLLGAAITGILSIISIQAIIRFTRLREDAAIGIVLSVFFGAGVVMLSYIQTNAPAGSAGLAHFIYGQVAAMNAADVRLMAAIAALTIITMILLRKEFTLICFNDAFARATGWPVSLISAIMMALVALITVAGLQAVGILLIVAMLIIPPAAARFWTESLNRLLLIAAAIGGVSGYVGSAISAILPDQPAGAVIVLTAATLFCFSMVAAPSRGVIAAAIKRIAFRLRIAGEHLLEAASEQHANELSPTLITSVATTRSWSPIFRACVLAWLRHRQYTAPQTASTSTGLPLTAAGIERGKRVSRNHALWEQYLIAHADIAPSHVDWSVDQVEHVLTEELVAELEARLANQNIAPHGGIA